MTSPLSPSCHETSQSMMASPTMSPTGCKVVGLHAEEDSDFAMFETSTIAQAEIEAKDMDSMIAKELSSLSIQELENVYNDVHCLSSEIPENPELIQECLAQLELELGKINEKTAYNLARSMDSSYVENVKFRLQFLRADRLNPARTAERIVRHFQVKLELFGMNLLARDITQDDLDDDALVALYEGTGQALPMRDRAGRLTMVSFGYPYHISITAKLKYLFYITMVNAEDVETQRKGCVLIVYVVGQTFSWSELSHRRAWSAKCSSWLSNAAPLRVDAVHFCHDSIVWRALYSVFQIATTKSHRVRTRENCGTHSECMVYLQSFGIPIHVFPLSSDGTLLVDAHVEKWTLRRTWERKRRRAVEKGDPVREENPGTAISSMLEEFSRCVNVPGREDILLGRGQPRYLHPGNIRLRNLIELRSQEYDNATSAGKRRITNEIIHAIQERTGRFLRNDGLCWVEVDDSVTKKKVAQAFRTLRQSRKTAQKTIGSDGSLQEATTPLTDVPW